MLINKRSVDEQKRFISHRPRTLEWVCVCVCCSSVFSVAGLTEICSCSVCVCVCVRFSLTSRGGRRTSAHELLFHSCPSSLGLVFARALSLRSVRRGRVYPECTKARKDRFTHKALLPIASQSSLSISLSYSFRDPDLWFRLCHPHTHTERERERDTHTQWERERDSL